MPPIIARNLKLKLPRQNQHPVLKLMRDVMPVTQNNTSSIKIPLLPKPLVWKFTRYWLPVISYAILIFYLSSIPGNNIPSLFSNQDILFHIIEYAIFTMLFNRALKAYFSGLVYIRRIFWVFFVVCIYAITDELHQAFVPNRFCSGWDLAFDSAGVLMGSIFCR